MNDPLDTNKQFQEALRQVVLDQQKHLTFLDFVVAILSAIAILSFIGIFK